MYCRNCGTQLDDRAVACTKCGLPPRIGGAFCYNCGRPTLPNTAACVNCGVGLLPMVQHDPRASNKIAAGVCGILLGAFGVHKFILGYTAAGLTMLLITVLTCGIAGVAMHLIGICEGIIYLTKTDEDFVYTYVLHRREWF